jgi:hypothetical protein
MKLDPHSALHNCTAFQYWFGLISFARERKASFASHDCRHQRWRFRFFFWGLTSFKAARPYWTVEAISSLLLKSLGASDCLAS